GAAGGVTTDGTVIAGNYIGTDISGQKSLANASDGILDIGATNTRIGTGAGGVVKDAERNVIAANKGRGITVTPIQIYQLSQVDTLTGGVLFLPTAPATTPPAPFAHKVSPPPRNVAGHHATIRGGGH